MRRYITFLVTCVVIATAIILAYAPWAAHLSTTDPSPLRATFAIMVPVACLAAFGLAAWYAFAPRPRVRFDIDDELTLDSVKGALSELSDRRYIGHVCHDALSQAERLERRVRACEVALADTFGKDSMTYDRYMSGVSSAETCATKALASVAMRASSFDEYEYSDARARGSSVTTLMDAQVNELETDVRKNEDLIAELMRLQSEVEALDATEASSDTEEALSDMRELVEQTRYYA